MWAMIGTWLMSEEGMKEGMEILRKGGSSQDAVEEAVKNVEANPCFTSVGYGGLPNREMDVEMDSGFMDGDTLSIGAVSALRDFAHPVSIARCFSRETLNNFLTGEGAERFAAHHGFERKNMLTQNAKARYEQKKREMDQGEVPYAGHDTVGMLGLDQNGCITAATSTSGLFMKLPGRVGDSPMPGSGFYADSKAGAAAATGMGEDIMKGCISYEIVRRMKEGEDVQKACENAVRNLNETLCLRNGEARDISVVAMDRQGNFGAATNIQNFSFVCACENQELKVCTASCKDGHTVIEEAGKDFIAAYYRRHSQNNKEQ
jgi:isoaspartyl peptidase/L-asparaginase-like protein (Ntn-hydrolase superfamily)